MASSSSKRKGRSHDVFLSFRGPDVRNNFLDHLYTALDQAGIHTYIDNEELRKGEQISTALMNAIEDSQIAIIIFSKNYASSPWCLEELTKIMERKKQGVLIVWPVFYKVQPCEVRTPRESYREAMAKHEVKFEKEPQKVERWKKALFDAGSLSGWDSTDWHEAELLKHIVQEVSTQLDRVPLDVAKYPIGIDSRVKQLKAILNLESRDDVLMVGLWGQGGVGKTTLAKAMYNAVFREFHGSSFLERVRENSKNSNGLVHLQEKLLSMLLLGKNSTIYNVDEGSSLLQGRLCNKKVLVILDDVDDECQLNALAGNCEWFGKGSRIIITTRNRHLLTSRGVDRDHMYEVEALNDGEALELFRRHAFQGNQKIEVSSNLVDRVIHYAGGLPLALGVLGSFLCGRGEPEWESTLQKLAKSPDKKINDVLKVSYGGLDEDVKEIFLDIACFFKGWKTSDINKILDSCEFSTTIGIEILIERSLINEESGTLQMHDLTQLMGMDIVKEECRDDPGKRSRLWHNDDFLNVLSEDAGTGAIKAIVLKLPMPEEMHIGPDAFTKMKKLRLLILHNVHSSFPGIVHLPNELRWFEWPHCASTPEFKAGPKKLVGLNLRNSNIEGVLKQFKQFRMMKYINFSRCHLNCVPDLSFAPNLESLDFSECKSLAEVHQSVGHLEKLEFLSLAWCSNLNIFPSELKTKSLQELNLSGFSRLEKFPDIMEKMEHLERLYLDQTAIKELPSWIANLEKLECLSLGMCSNLSIFPSELKTKSLQKLNLSRCSRLGKFPDILEKMEHLERLFLDQTAIEELPPSIVNLVSVKDIWLRNCKNLARLPPSIYKLRNLEFLTLEGCSNFAMFPKNLEDSTDLDGALGFPNLHRLDLQGCSLSELEFLEDSSNFPKLIDLNLSENKFTHLRINNCGNLERLFLEKCKQLQEISRLPSYIRVIRANNCRSLQKLPDFSHLSNFSEVDFSSCSGLSRKAFDLPGVSILEYLRETQKIKQIILIGEEMPEWILPCEDGYVSCMVPKDFYDKVQGLALCVVFGLEEGEVDYVMCGVHVDIDNGMAGSRHATYLSSLESNHVWLGYTWRGALFEGKAPQNNDWSHFQVRLQVSNASIKKCGFRLICQQLEDDLRVIVQPPPPIETNRILEKRDSEEDHSINIEEEDSPIEIDEGES